MRKFVTLAAVAAFAFATVLPTTASAEDKDPQEMMKYRQSEMGAMASHMGAIKRILTGAVDRPEDLLGHTAAMVALSKDIPTQYPEGTGPDALPKTEALPKIWKDAEGFAKAATAYETAAGELHAAAEKRDMDAAMEAFKKVGESCGGCHDNYRKDD